MFRLLLIAVFFASASFGYAQRTSSTWMGQSEQWFDSKNWTNGVPGLQVNAFVPEGLVIATTFPGVGGPSAGNLVVGSTANGAGQASLEVLETSLDVLGTLEVARANGGDVEAQLITESGGIRQACNVVVGESMGIGIANPGFTTVGNATVNAAVHVGGNLLARDGSSPTLSVGVLNGTGSVFSDLVVENSIGSKSQGFSNVAIGTVGQGAFGDVTTHALAQDLFGNGESTLQVGSNFGSGIVDASLHIDNGLHGFQFAQIGNGNSRGAGFGTLSIGEFLEVERVEVGNRDATGRGRIDFLPGSTFQGSSLTVHPQSRVTLPSFATGKIFNNGRLNIADEPKLPSIARIESDFVQAEEGVTVFDVRNLDPEFGYERLEIGGVAEVDGRFDIRFADDFKPERGEFQFISASAINGNAAVRLINPPADLAVLPTFEDGFRLEIVEPEPFAFNNPGEKGLSWFDRNLWGGELPQAFHQIKLINDQSFPQSIVVADGVAQSLVLGGENGMSLVVPTGEKFTVTHDLTVEAGSSVGLPQAQLIASNLILDRGASLTNASGSVLGNVANSGIVEIGSDEFTQLQIDGDFSQAASGLIRLDLLGNEKFDKVVVDGVADLDGKLFINVPEDLDLSEGIRLPLIEAAEGIKGNLDIHLFGPKLRDVNFQFKQDDEGVTLFTISADFATLGDMNADGVKDATDILAFSMALTDVSEYLNDDISNGVHPLFPGDLNFDGSLDLDDIEPFLDCIEADICLPEFAVIPEPSSIQLAMFSLGGLVVLRRRERTRREVR